LNKLLLIQNYLFYTGFISEIIPLIFCILFFKKLNTKALKVFFIYTCVLCVFSVLSIVALKLLQEKTLYLLLVKIYNILEFSVISLFLYNLFKNEIIKKIVLYVIIPFVVISIVDYLINDKTKFNNHSNLASSFLLIIYIIYYFYEKMKTVVMYPLYQSISFWICVGFFLNFTGTFFFILFIKSSTDKEFKILMNTIYGVVTITKNILLCLSLFASEYLETNDDTLHIPSEIDLDEFSLANLKNP